MLAAQRGADLHRHPAARSSRRLRRAPERAGRCRARPRLSRRQLRLSRRRAPPPGRAGRAGRADPRAARRHQRCALSPPRRKPLADVLACIREKCTIADAGYRLEANAERHLKPAPRWRGCSRSYPQAVARTLEIAERIRFTLDELRYEYPDEPVPPGKTPQAYLEELTWAHAAETLSRRHAGQGARAARQGAGADRPARLRALFPHRLRHRALRPRARTILCQGRGSAANSAVCFCLGITARRSHRDRPAVRALHLGRPRASRPTSTSISSTSGARR